jgi:hypothetical protein
MPGREGLETLLGAVIVTTSYAVVERVRLVYEALPVP